MNANSFSWVSADLKKHCAVQKASWTYQSKNWGLEPIAFLSVLSFFVFFDVSFLNATICNLIRMKAQSAAATRYYFWNQSQRCFIYSAQRPQCNYYVIELCRVKPYVIN